MVALLYYVDFFVHLLLFDLNVYVHLFWIVFTTVFFFEILLLQNIERNSRKLAGYNRGENAVHISFRWHIVCACTGLTFTICVILQCSWYLFGTLNCHSEKEKKYKVSLYMKSYLWCRVIEGLNCRRNAIFIAI